MLFDMNMSDDMPIGWWVKHLDRTLEDALDRAVAVEGVSRRQWQMLNLAAENGELSMMAPFFADPAEADAPVAGLVDRGWIRRHGQRLELTPDGSLARDRLSIVVRGQRQRIMDGIEPTEYAATVDVLRRMAENVAGAG
jgi:DNA-binding MarR family transcriptional regulator